MTDIIPVVTIDGPGGTGKGTVSQLIAKRLGWHLLDSGALYRLLAVAAKRHDVDYDDAATLEVLAEHLDVAFIADEQTDTTHILLEGDEVTDLIRSDQWAQGASQVASIQQVRNALIARQRAFRLAPGLVADGRDMGTVIFPDAILKVFLVACREERAYRRYNQLKGKGINANLEDILRELSERDKRDITRKAAPLAPADDAIIIDTTDLSIIEVVVRVMAAVEERMAQE